MNNYFIYLSVQILIFNFIFVSIISADTDDSQEFINSGELSTDEQQILLPLSSLWEMYISFGTGRTATQSIYPEDSNKSGYYGYGNFFYLSLGVEKSFTPNFAAFAQVSAGNFQQKYFVSAIEIDSQYYFSTGLIPRVKASFDSWDYGIELGGKYYIGGKDRNSFNPFVALGMDFVLKTLVVANITDDISMREFQYQIEDISDPFDFMINIGVGVSYMFNNLEITFQGRAVINVLPIPAGYETLSDKGFSYLWHDSSNNNPEFDATYVEIVFSSGYYF